MEAVGKSNNLKKVYVFFITYLILFAVNLILPASFLSKDSYTSRMWLFLQLFVIVPAIYLIIKEGLPKGKAILNALLFGVLAGLLNPMVGVWTMVTYMASARIFEKYNKGIPIFKSNRLKDITISVAIALVIGLILGYINIILSKQPLNFEFRFIYLLLSLNPGIFEEISLRLFMYAFCLYLLRGETDTKVARVWCYILMILPHVLVHLPDTLINYGIVSFIVYTAIFIVLFGIPLTLLQMRRDLASAMIVHGLVDLIRFSYLGLPF